jgi:hypothetical protein
MDRNRFHACASCIHFFAGKTDDGMMYKCTRLGYETRPEYKFNCWEPKEKVKKLMEKEKGSRS